MIGFALSFLSKYKMFFNPTLLLGIALIAVIGLGYVYVHKQKVSIARMKAELILNELTMDAKDGEIAAKVVEIQLLKDSMAFSKQIRDSLNLELKESRFIYTEAKKVFDEHDFAYLLERKPELMSDRMRDGTDRVFTAIEREANR